MIIKPVFTEKSYAATALDRFTFKVDKRATKTEIKNEIKKLYGVTVVSVNTARAKSQSVRSAKIGKYITTPGFKKAIVRLKSGQKIALFNT